MQGSSLGHACCQVMQFCPFRSVPQTGPVRTRPLPSAEHQAATWSRVCVPHSWARKHAPGRRCTSHIVCGSWWSVDSVRIALRKKRLEERTVERIYEADVYPAVFDFAAWHQHRSRRRYLEHMITLFRSYFFRDLLGPLTVLIGIAVSVGLYETALGEGLLPSWLPDFRTTSDTPFQLTSFALSLMLVFRTNSSYSRWLDARIQWGLIVNTARTFIRQAMTTLPEETCYELRQALARWTIAFVRLGKLHLREDGDVRQEMQDLLLPEELPLVLTSTHRPLTACHVLSEVLRQAEAAGHLAPLCRLRLEQDLNMLSQALGACEKVLRNPIPLSYTRHTARFLILWLVWLPIALWAKVGWGVVPVEAIMAYLLLGIDEIAIQMEEPFGILPLESLCSAVQISVNLVSSTDHAVHELVAGYACSMPPATASEAASAAASQASASVAQCSGHMGNGTGVVASAGGATRRHGGMGQRTGSMASDQGVVPSSEGASQQQQQEAAATGSEFASSVVPVKGPLGLSARIRTSGPNGESTAPGGYAAGDNQPGSKASEARRPRSVDWSG